MQASSVSISTQTPGTRPNTHVPRGFVTLLLNASDEVERIATRLKRYSEHRRYLKYGCVTAMLRLNNLPRSLWRRRETKQCDTSFSLACCHRTLKHSAIVTASPIESDQPTVVPTAETEGRISPMQCTSLALYARHGHTLQTAAFQPHGGMPLVIKKTAIGTVSVHKEHQPTVVPTAEKNATQRVVDLRPYSLRPKRTLVQSFYGTKVRGCFDNFCQRLFLW